MANSSGNDWTKIGAEFLMEFQKEFNAQDIVYTKASDSSTTNLCATLLNFTQKEMNDRGWEGPTAVSATCCGFVFDKTLIAFEPSPGDTITIALDGDDFVFQVKQTPSGKPFQYFDKYNLQYQVTVVANETS